MVAVQYVLRQNCTIMRVREDREVMSDATVSEKISLYKLMYDSL